MELRQSDEYSRYMELIGWNVYKSKTSVWIYLKKMPILPYSVMKVQRVDFDNLDFDWLKGIVKKDKVVLQYIELLNEIGDEQSKKLKSLGYKTQSQGMLATRTLRVSTNFSADGFISQMKSKTRYNLRLAKKKNLQVEIINGDELLRDHEKYEEFIFLLQQNSKRLKMLKVNEKWVKAMLTAFGDKGYVILIRNNDDQKLVSGNLFLTNIDGSYYEYNGSTEMGRKMMAPTLAVFEGWKEAKRRKLKYLDFDGIYDDRYPLKRWRGFSNFKKSFGGKELLYPPSHKKWF